MTCEDLRNDKDITEQKVICDKKNGAKLLCIKTCDMCSSTSVWSSKTSADRNEKNSKS